MLANIRDRRASPESPECDVVFEPAAHHSSKRADGKNYFAMDEALRHVDYFRVHSVSDTTVREAVFLAETEWGLPVTLYLYDKGSRPLG